MSELKQGLFRLIYWTWLHNSEAIAYFIAIVFVIVLLLKRAKRKYVLILIGFVFLLLKFEYVKHVLDPLKDQTMSTILQGEVHHKAEKIMKLFFDIVVPIGLWIAGWGNVLIGIAMGEKEKK